MTEVSDMSPNEYREARAALVRVPAKVSAVNPPQTKEVVLAMTDTEYKAARRKFIATNGA
jgi:hypothetical protein